MFLIIPSRNFIGYRRKTYAYYFMIFLVNKTLFFHFLISFASNRRAYEETVRVPFLFNLWKIHLLSSCLSTHHMLHQFFSQRCFSTFLLINFHNLILAPSHHQMKFHMGLHGNLWVNQREIHQNPSSVKRQSGITAPVGRFYSVCRLTAARTWCEYGFCRFGRKNDFFHPNHWIKIAHGVIFCYHTIYYEEPCAWKLYSTTVWNSNAFVSGNRNLTKRKIPLSWK